MSDEDAEDVAIYDRRKAELADARELPPEVSARMLTMEETAEVLGVSRRWLQDFLPTIYCPYLRVGRKKLFDEIAVSAIREAMRCPESSLRPKPGVRRKAISPSRSQPTTPHWVEVLERLRAKKCKPGKVER